MKVKGERLKVRGGWRVAIVVLLFTFHLSPLTLQAQDVKPADLKAYKEALSMNYRFGVYGDAMLIIND